MSKFSLLQTVDQQVKAKLAEAIKEKEHNTLVVEAFTSVAQLSNTTCEKLFEAVTHVLANIAATASQGAPIKAMNAASLASFLAGVEALAAGLPKANDEQKANAKRILDGAAIGPDGVVTQDVAKIAQLGSKKLESNLKYGEIVKKYVAASNAQEQGAGQELAQVARKLQAAIDSAMRSQPGAPAQDLQTRVQQGASQLAPKQMPQSQPDLPRAQAQAPQRIA